MPGEWMEGGKRIIWPKSLPRAPPPEVPQHIAIDYAESSAILVDSPKASAALSRRCLQAILRDAAHAKHGDLAREIDEVLARGTLPSHVANSIDAIRIIGNFAAHPTKSQTTGEIVPVEEGEAEWLLDTVEDLLDFFYVQPAKIAAKRAALDAKLKDIGKPPMKSRD